MRRDYGLIELGFNSDPAYGWVCFSAMIQIHRLTWETPVPAAIRNRVLSVPPAVPFAEFRDALESRGERLVKRDDLNFSDFDYYYAPGSESRISVLTEDDDELLVANSVWSIALW